MVPGWVSRAFEMHAVQPYCAAARRCDVAGPEVEVVDSWIGMGAHMCTIRKHRCFWTRECHSGECVFWPY